MRFSSISRDIRRITKYSSGNFYDLQQFKHHRITKATMTLWSDIDSEAKTWFAMFRGPFSNSVEYEMHSMIAAWTDEETAKIQFAEYLLWERRGGRDGICTMVRYPVSIQFEIRSKTIGIGDESMTMLDYHKPWWDFTIARDNNELVEVEGG